MPIYKNKNSGIDSKYGSIKIFADQFRSVLDQFHSITIYAGHCLIGIDQHRSAFNFHDDKYWYLNKLF